MSTYFYNYGSTLYHHGTKGQKWGVRNFQNEDGSYTPRGQAENNGHGRYSDTDDNSRTGKSASSKMKYESGSSQKVKEQQGKSGLTEQQKKLLKGAAIGAAVALGVGTAVYIYSKKKVNPTMNDITIDADSVIQRISPSEEKELHDVFYAAINDHDKQRYENMLPKHYSDRGAKEVLKKEIKVNHQIKVAGHDTCEKIFNDMLKDDATFEKLKKLGFASDPFRDLDRTAVNKTLNKYDSFNKFAVAARQDGYKEVYDTFFNKLKDAGYQGFLDINDQKYSGYNAKAPVILFNDTDIFNQSKVSVLNNSPGQVINKYYKESNKAAIEQMVKDVVNDPITTATYGAYITAGGAYLGMIAAGNTKSKKKETNKPNKK